MGKERKGGKGKGEKINIDSSTIIIKMEKKL